MVEGSIFTVRLSVQRIFSTSPYYRILEWGYLCISPKTNYYRICLLSVIKLLNLVLTSWKRVYSYEA